MKPSGFRPPSVAVSESDCRDFIRAWEAGLICHQGRGLYKAPMSAAHEQFFNSGAKAAADRAFYLAIEAVITVAGLARLHFDHGWPAELLGTQSRNYAFDLVAYRASEAPLHIACEVKKTVRESDRLVALMNEFAVVPAAEAPASGARRNAWKKLEALVLERPAMFWVLGPGGHSAVFDLRDVEGRLTLVSSTPDALRRPTAFP